MKSARNIQWIMVLAVFCSGLVCGSGLAMPARKTMVTINQPDGTPIQARFFGDEWYHFTETEDGYTIIKDTNGWWRYAQLDERGKFRPSDINVTTREKRKTDEIQFINSLQKHLRESGHVIDEHLDNLHLQPFELNPRVLDMENAAQDTENVLVILIDFPDYNYTYADTSFDSLMNVHNYNGDGSVNDYFQEISYGQLEIQATVVGWYTAPESLSYYRWEKEALVRSINRVHELVAYAVKKAEDDGIDFSHFDNDGNHVVDRLIIVHAGFGREDMEGDYIWSHRHYLNWSYGDSSHVCNEDTVNGYAIVPELNGCSSGHVKIGVFCHEYGHLLGLPDLYDPDGSSNGIGTWGLMGLGGWGADCNSPQSPTHMCAWSKVKLNWVTPVVPMADTQQVQILHPEKHDVIYKLWTNGDVSSEYFLLENRQSVGFDDFFDDKGLVIWHVDETVVDRRGRVTNRNELHSAVALEAVDEVIDTTGQGDPFDVGETFSFNTTPSSQDYRGNNTFITVNINSCVNDTIIIVDLSVESPSGTIDLLIRDCPNDLGIEPNDSCLNDFVRSPDIWIDNDGDGEPDPYAAGVVNRIWARIWNIGSAPATDVEVTFWRTKPTLGLTIPDDMEMIYDDITGDSVVSVSLVPANSLMGNDTVKVFIDALLPDPPYCFGVIVENDEDPQAHSLALLDNNVAQLNVWSERQLSIPGDPTLFTSKLYVANPTDIPDTFEVEVDAALLPPGWTASVEPETFYLESDADSCTIEVTIPAGAQHGDSGFVNTHIFRMGETDTSLGIVVLDAGVDNIKPKSINDLTALILTAEGDNFSTDESTVRLTWLPVQVDSAGNPEKIRLYYIYRDTLIGFVPNSINLIDSVAADEDMLIPEFQWNDEPEFTPEMAKARSPQTYYPTFYYKVISVDRAGNRSDPSNEVYPVLTPPPMLHLLKSDGCKRCGPEADNIVIKPDRDHDVCVYIDDIHPYLDIETIHFMLTWNGDLQFMRPGIITFDCTELDSSGWDIKHHRDDDPGAGRDSLEVWLIAGGHAQHPLGQAGCILRIGFHTQVGAQPGDRDTIHFEFAQWNEGGEMTTNDFYKKINEPPVVSWDGIDAPDSLYWIYLQESHEYTFRIDAHDYDIDCNYPCGDSVILWAQSDPITDPCPWSEGATFDTTAVRFICGIERFGVLGCGYTQGQFQWHPPKLGVCDTVWIDFIAASTWLSGQCLYDTLTVGFIIDDCAFKLAWNYPPPAWNDPCENPPIYPDTLQVYACEDVEIPLAMHFDYDYVLDDTIWSISAVIDYDNRLGVFEVGNEGLITEHIGTLTSRIVSDYSTTDGRIYISMAFNQPLQWPPFPQEPDPINPPFGFIVSCWYKLLYVGFHIPSELEEATGLILTIDNFQVNEMDNKTCWIDTTHLIVREFAVSGRVLYSDNNEPVPGVILSTLNACGGMVSTTDTTDEVGAYESLPWPGCSDFCLEPWAESDPDVWDQIVTAYDATLILRALVGNFAMSHNDSLAADVTGDGTIGAFDASVIMKWVVCNYCGTELIPAEHIGDWIFEYDGDLTDQLGVSCVCYDELTADHLNEEWDAVIIGDVSQNWPGPAAKKVVEGIDVAVGSTDITVGFAEPVSAVDMVMTFGSDLKVIDVSAGAEAVEWMAQANGLRVAAASARSFQSITVTFEQLTPTDLEISARVDEDIMMTAAAKVVPMPVEYALAQNYPNPFNPVTDIRYQIADGRCPVRTSLTIYNILGQAVWTLVDEIKEPGYYTATWDGKDASGTTVASGVYLYRLKAGDFTATKRMVLLK